MVPPISWLKVLLTVLTAAAASSAGVSAQSLPGGVTSHWQHYNNAGWMAFQRGDYNAAELNFDRAIEILRPYQTQTSGF